ncbi:MAG: hypothetical protein BAJALOKI2v1_310020 [Promethearchaeota archaeon]|nr:MAG: hypothetical protein BAJALOKI2v1_310020 [Candidatus Lokiarchaeota archaeon]
MKDRDKNFDIFTSQLDLPFLGSDEEAFNKIFKVLRDNFTLKPNSQQKFIDLGSGDGRVVIYIALKYGLESFGIEINENLINESKEKVQNLRKNGKLDGKLLDKITFIYGDFYNLDLGEYDFIYLYSLPTMQKFLKHILKSARKDAIFIAYKYPLDVLEGFLEAKKSITVSREEPNIKAYYYKKK